jgi:hypothetical protein
MNRFPWNEFVRKKWTARAGRRYLYHRVEAQRITASSRHSWNGMGAAASGVFRGVVGGKDNGKSYSSRRKGWSDGKTKRTVDPIKSRKSDETSLIPADVERRSLASYLRLVAVAAL